jgi:hypothetical protein
LYVGLAFGCHVEATYTRKLRYSSFAGAGCYQLKSGRNMGRNLGKWLMAIKPADFLIFSGFGTVIALRFH